MDKVYTTLAQIRTHSPCEDGWKKLCKNLGGLKEYGEDTPLTFNQIHKSNGHNDTMWCLRTTDKSHYPLWRHFAVDAAEMVENLMKDARSINALRVARRHSEGKATDEELAAAWAAAGDAAGDAAGAAQSKLLFEYCRTGARVDWKTFFGGNPLEAQKDMKKVS